MRVAPPDPSPMRRPVRLVHVLTVPTTLLFFRGQVGYMKARGFDLTFVASPGPELDAFGEQEGVATVAVEMPRRISIGEDLVAVRRLVGELRRVRPDVVHSHTPKGGLLGMIAAAVAGVPVRVYHMRGLAFLGATGARRALLRATERVACRLAHRVICVSASNKRVAVEEGLCPAAKIVVLSGGSSNGVDAEGRFNPDGPGTPTRTAARAALGLPEGAPVVGFVGRVVRDKGLIELAGAWATLRELYPEAHLLVAGPFERQDPLPPAVERALRDDPRVHAPGEVRDTPALFAAMDVLALPTYREGFPNVLLEAAAMRLPVVATAVPGCTDAVEDGVTGLLVPPYRADALADALDRYLADPALRRAHGDAARARVLASFRREGIWEALHAEYETLLGGWLQRSASPEPA